MTAQQHNRPVPVNPAGQILLLKRPAQLFAGATNQHSRRVICGNHLFPQVIHALHDLDHAAPRAGKVPFQDERQSARLRVYGQALG